MESIKCINSKGTGHEKRAITSLSPFYAHSYFPEPDMSHFKCFSLNDFYKIHLDLINESITV